MGKKEIDEMNILAKKTNLNKLVNIIDEFSHTGKAIIVEGINTKMTEAKKKKIMSELTNVAIVADKEVKKWVGDNIPTSYIAGANTTQLLMAEASRKIPKMNVTFKVLNNVKNSVHLQAVNNILSDAYLDFGYTMTGYVRGAERIINDAMRQQLRARIAEGRLSGEAIYDVKKTIVQTFKDRGFTVLVDRGGRQWELSRYAEMIARTHIIRANNEGSINRMGDYGIDIVQISEHGATDKICQKYEGKIYSLSGNSENYPKIEVFPPFHPNCAHTVLPRPDLV